MITETIVFFQTLKYPLSEDTFKSLVYIYANTHTHTYAVNMRRSSIHGSSTNGKNAHLLTLNWPQIPKEAWPNYGVIVLISRWKIRML